MRKMPAINEKSVHGETALHRAAHSGDLEMLKLLVDHGADMFARNADWKKPVDAAKEAKHLEVVKFLQARESFLEKLLYAAHQWNSWLALAAGSCGALIYVLIDKYFEAPMNYGTATDLEKQNLTSSPGHEYMRGARLLAAKAIGVAPLGSDMFRFFDVTSSLAVAVLGMVIIRPCIWASALAVCYAVPSLLVFGSRRLLQQPVLIFATRIKVSALLLALVRLVALVGGLITLVYHNEFYCLEHHPSPPPHWLNSDQCLLLANPSMMSVRFASKGPLSFDALLVHFTLVPEFPMQDFAGVVLFLFVPGLCLLISVAMCGFYLCRGLSHWCCGWDTDRTEQIQKLATRILAVDVLAETSPITQSAVDDGDPSQSAGDQSSPLQSAADDSDPLHCVPWEKSIDYKCGCIPAGGLKIKTWTAILDCTILDTNTIMTLLLSQNYIFAGCMIAIVGGSILGQWRDGSLPQLMNNLDKSVARRIRHEGFMRYIDRETGFEALFSTIITAYSLKFAVTTPLQLLTQTFSILVSLHGLSSFVHEKLDLLDSEDP
eukprot:TRINITY_DN9496_c0_g1_i5.p1 TRINITY_DN9496_c0_g1~~TRINITY_DN9496_c0_g1_i5.p1  ORF type:complete len:546 (-),score=66.80 TRINITY_DN9496_c0_g1_i5:227-1864(-)